MSQRLQYSVPAPASAAHRLAYSLAEARAYWRCSATRMPARGATPARELASGKPGYSAGNVEVGMQSEFEV